MQLKDLPVFFLDLQTTGAKPGTADILEVAWSLSGTDKVHSVLAAQAEDRPVPRRILSLTGIAADELEGAHPLSDILERLYQDIQDRPGVIHFAQFERPFLKAAFESFRRPEFPIICTHEIAKRLFPNLPARGIKGLAGYFGHSSGEFKRGASHVEATKVIWQHLVQELECKGILTLLDMQTWLSTEAPKKRTKYEYPLPKEKRLNLPKVPGVYRYVSQWGEILYVGKATSLHDRVNSYFRGQKGRDSFKLEMLTQAYDLVVTPCRTPLEAALLETDEIKKHNPRYNISLKTGDRSLTFFSHDFLSASAEQDELHPIGPFSNSQVFESLQNLQACLSGENQEFHDNIFFDPLPAELIQQGFHIFCERQKKSPQDFSSLRSILAYGLHLVRTTLEEIVEEDSVEDDDQPEEEIPELTAEDIADKFERHFKRGALAYLRARKLTRLLNSDIEYMVTSKDERLRLHFRNGHQGLERLMKPSLQAAWRGHSIETYDRMSVLWSELEKIRQRDGSYSIL